MRLEGNSGAVDTSARVAAGSCDSAHPVTYSVRWAVRPGSEQAFEAILDGMVKAASRFTGHMGVSVFRPADHQHPEYHIVVKFASHALLRNWLDSGERQAWLARAAPHEAGPPRLDVLTGLETWFSLPGSPVNVLPPRWKVCVASWLAIFPLVCLFRLCLGPMIGGASMPLQSLILSVCLTPTMTYAAMPWMTRRLAWWLYPRDNRADNAPDQIFRRS